MNKKVLIIIATSLLIDQLSKILISMFLELNGKIVVIKNFFSLYFTKNYGAAWSTFANQVPFLFIISLVALFIVYRYMKTFKENKRNNLAFGLLMGGIMGNIIDRLFLGCVRDFLSFKIFSYDYPVFNFADTFIVIGVILVIFAILKGEDKNAEV